MPAAERVDLVLTSPSPRYYHNASQRHRARCCRTIPNLLFSAPAHLSHTPTLPFHLRCHTSCRKARAFVSYLLATPNEMALEVILASFLPLPLCVPVPPSIPPNEPLSFLADLALLPRAPHLCTLHPQRHISVLITASVNPIRYHPPRVCTQLYDSITDECGTITNRYVTNISESASVIAAALRHCPRPFAATYAYPRHVPAPSPSLAPASAPHPQELWRPWHVPPNADACTRLRTCCRHCPLAHRHRRVHGNPVPSPTRYVYNCPGAHTNARTPRSVGAIANPSQHSASSDSARARAAPALCACAGGNVRVRVGGNHTLSSIFVDIDFVGPFPSPQQIPKLQSVKARPADIPQFTPHALQDLWFFTDGIHSVSTLRAADLVKFATSPALLVVIRISAPQLIQLLEAAPRILRNLRHIVLDEDPSWSRFTFEQGQAPSSAVLKRLSILLGIGGRLRCLRSLLLVCAQKRLHDDYRPILRRSQGPLFARYIRLYCTAPQLRVLNFFAFDGYARWTRWRESAEVMVYQDIDLDDHWPPADLEEPQISTIVENKRPRRPLLAFKTVRSLWTPGTSADGAARAIRPIAPIIIIRAETRRRRVRSAPTPTPKDKLGTLATPEAEEAWCAAFESLRKTLLEKKSVNDATVISEATQEPISGADFVAGSSGKGKVID
ncbi:hypothetical protein R3P38DRAFT_3271024 [Favolaschia claudopus]|uniref:Uncharacterized protein n=1 Tax=Favolaschia claudopus TaxID=2862362 RepID=A0AAW0B984_9AGAR